MARQSDALLYTRAGLAGWLGWAGWAGLAGWAGCAGLAGLDFGTLAIFPHLYLEGRCRFGLRAGWLGWAGWAGLAGLNWSL